jgi:hypothetical protein
LLAAALEAAVEHGYLPGNLAENVTLPAQTQHGMRFLDADEIRDLADAIDPGYRALVLTAAYTVYGRANWQACG